MKIKLDQEVVHPNGKPITYPDGSTMKVKDVVMSGLSFFEERMSSQTKTKRYQIALKVVSGDEVDLTTDEIVEIKKSIEQTTAPFVYGFVSTFLG